MTEPFRGSVLRDSTAATTRSRSGFSSAAVSLTARRSQRIRISVEFEFFAHIGVFDPLGVGVAEAAEGDLEILALVEVAGEGIDDE